MRVSSTLQTENLARPRSQQVRADDKTKVAARQTSNTDLTTANGLVHHCSTRSLKITLPEYLLLSGGQVQIC
jgi:hypothetical protein